MRFKNTAVIMLLVLTSALVSGCSVHRRKEPRSVSEVFFGVTEAMIGILLDDSSQGKSESEKRRKWQCENLSSSELEELGIVKQRE